MHSHLMQINPKRFAKSFDGLAKIGATDSGGVHRPTFSPAHLAAREWFQEQARATGLDFKVDGAGNHSALLVCSTPNAPVFILGSHLDSVPDGGRFDGALGVVAALEVLRCIQEAKISLPFNLEAIDFTDEEGSLVGLLGSAAVTGGLKPADLLEPRGGRQALIEGLEIANLSEQEIFTAKRRPESLAGYLELHIEQGSRLIDAGKSVGIVTSIVGIGSYRLTFIGQANHAGTTSMQSRRDAAQGACGFALAVRDLVIEKFPECVVNIGDMVFKPGAFNIIPGSVTAALEYRAPDASGFSLLEEALLELAHNQARKFDLGLNIEFLGKHPPAPMSKKIQNSIAKATHTLKLESIPLASGAGHDAQSLAKICPAGMIFVPSKGGISHSPNEFTEREACINGANLLLQTVLEFAL